MPHCQNQETLRLALNGGEAHGFKPGTWLVEEDFGGHLAHARAHLDELQIFDGAFWVHDEDLSHAICRLVMAWAMRNAVAAKALPATNPYLVASMV